MHEQNFEKQVQQKMEELSLMPSAPVWQKVEEQIRKKKDRRRLIFWLLPLLLAGGGGAWWLLSGTPDRVAPTSIMDLTKQQSLQATPPPGHKPVQLTPSGDSEKTALAPDQDAITPPSNTPKNYYSAAPAKQPKLTASSTLPQLQATTDTKEDLAIVNETVTIGKPEVSVAKQNDTEPHKEVVARQTEKVISVEKMEVPVTEADTAGSFEKEVTTGSAEVPSPATPVIQAIIPVTSDSASQAKATPPQQLNIKKWQWTAHAEVGVTSVLAGFFELPSARTYAAFDRSAQFTSGNFFAYYPSPQEEGLSFSAGATAKRLINNRLKLTAGLQYSYYSTQMAVGQEKNAMATSTVPYARQAAAPANSYLPGVQNDYTNRYHFIQLPVGIEYQVLRNVPLQVHGGVAVAHLVRTNALTYDYQTQAYYQNRSAYHATQWHLFSNITYTLWKGKNNKLDIGPYVQYSLTDLQKTSSGKNRLFSTGLRTQVSF